MLWGAVALAFVVCLSAVYYFGFREIPGKDKPSGDALAKKSASRSDGVTEKSPPSDLLAQNSAVDKSPSKIEPIPKQSIVTKPVPQKKTPIVVAKTKPTPAAKTKTPTKIAPTVSADNLDWLIGLGRQIVLQTGREIKDAEVISIEPGPGQRTVKSITYKRPGAKTGGRLLGKAVRSISNDVGLVTLRYDKEQRTTIVESALTHEQVAEAVERMKREVAAEKARRRAEIVTRLRRRGNRIWPELSEDQQAKEVARHKQFLTKVSQRFANRGMKFRETNYFLFLTNLPPAEVNRTAVHLDEMYKMLCNAFGIAFPKNIWRGKCVIVAFVQAKDFATFEREFMNRTEVAGVQGLNHGRGNGDVITACYRGSSFSTFAKVLVHETTHGFLHRHFSSARIPSWVNEGIADWVAGKVVPSDRGVRDRQIAAIARMRQTRSMGGDFFTSGQMVAWQYGVASSLVDFMLRGKGSGPNGKYRLFIEDIKNGFTPVESLKRNYRVTPEALATTYGRSLRIGNLKP